jgi:hypothetical protein
LIFVGITLAIWFSNWNETRHVRAQEAQALADIATNLRVNADVIRGKITEDHNSVAACERVTAALARRDDWSSALGKELMGCRWWTSPFFNSAAYDSLKAKGTDLIADPALRAQIVNLYEQVYAFLMNDTDKVFWAFHTAVMEPILNRHVYPVSADEYVQQLRNEHAISRDVIRAYENGLARPLLDEVQRFLDEDAALLRARVAGNRIVDGHGDLRPEHVWLDTPPLVIDCLEFNERLRQVDPFDEIAYLGLECARLGAAWIGPRLLQRLAAALDDAVDPRLPRFYARYRACIRARLALAHLAEPSPREPERWQPLAQAYLRLGNEFDPTGA